ncbi:MAG TPA: hypothetical protein VNE40_04650 [Candidatus Dormibacteraeota bacterium]|nr:hypothetical protein [Candidatus Dormibacteraeota bacterium]
MTGEQIFPPGERSLQPMNQAPIEDGRGIFVSSHLDNWPLELTPRATNLAPLDEKALELGTKIALPIAQLPPYKKIYSKTKNGHHAAGFPATHPSLQGDDLRVIRWSRIQEGLRILHWRYHEYYDGIELPETDHQRFLSVLLYSAGYIPEWGVDVRGSQPKLIRLSEESRQALHEPGVLHQQDQMHWRIGYFFGRHILKYGLGDIREALAVSQFLETNDELKKRKLGHAVIRLAAEVVLDPIELVYQQAKSSGQIGPEQPTRALRFIMKHFDERQSDYFDIMGTLLRNKISA